MSETSGPGDLDLLPDRFRHADFNATELEQILGSGAEQRIIGRTRFNLVADCLVEKVGYLEPEVVDWFRTGAQALKWRTPLEVWGDPDGFDAVFGYAVQCEQIPIEE